MNSRSVGIFALVVAVVVGVALYYLNSNEAPHVIPDKPTVAAPTPAPEQPRLRPQEEPRTNTAPKQESTLATGNQKPAPQVVVPEMTEDDRKIDQILRLYPGNTDAENAKTAQALINVLPTLTPDGQQECINHIGNLLPDEEWNRLMPVWKNPNMNPDVLDNIMMDLMNREDTVKLPALVEAVRLPNHPQHDEAKNTLELYLDNDYGNDVLKWDNAVKEYLRKEAAEANPPPGK